MRRTAWNFWLLPGLFAFIGLLVYGQSIGNALVLWDDTYLLANNPIIRSITPQTLYHAFSTYDPELYIPLTFISYQIDYLIAGASPTMVHITNLLLHILNALLAGGILASLLRDRRLGFAFGLLFLVHPINTEAVAWASARKDVLSAFFGLSSLACFLRSLRTDNRRWYGASVFLFLLALLSKVTIAPMALLIGLVAWHEERKPKRAFAEAMPFLILAVALGIVAIIGKSHLESLITMRETVALSLQSLAFVLGKIAVPISLAPMYPVEPPVAVFSVATAIGLIVALALGVLSTIALRRSRTAALGIAWFLLFIVPSFATFSKGDSVFLASDRYAYVALIGVLLAIAAFLRPHIATMHTPITVTFVTIACLLGFLAFGQAALWRDSETLFLHTLKVQPRAAAAANNLGVLYFREDKLEAAEAQFKATLALRPFANTYVMLGNIRRKQQRYQDALAEYGRAHALSPNNPEPLFLMGVTHAAMGDDAQAIAQFNAVLALQPKYMPAMNNLAALLLEQGKLEESERIYRTLLAYNPYYHDAQVNFALLLQRQGKNEEALAYIRSALERTPEDAGIASLALEIARAVLEKDPDNAQAKALVAWMLEEQIIQRK